MKYYRLASYDSQTKSWRWKTTPLTSLPAVFHLLRLYAALPQDRLRVFTASSKADLSEMLRYENQNEVSGSVTAVQFLHERHMQIQGQGVLEQPTVEQVARQTTVANYLPSNEQRTSESIGMSSLDKKRLELELGAGGDHDSPYTFTLPTFVPELLAWVRLQSRVQHGELGLEVF